MRYELNAFRLSSKWPLCIWFANGGIVVNIGKIPFSHNIAHSWCMSLTISINSFPCSKSTDPKLIITLSCCISLMVREIFFIALLIFCPDTHLPICLTRLPKMEQFNKLETKYWLMLAYYVMCFCILNLCKPIRGRNCRQLVDVRRIHSPRILMKLILDN